MTVRVSSRRFIDALSARGFGPYVGVPCSFLRPLIDYVIDRADLEYIAATNEGEALAIAAGAQLAGRKPVVLLQNSGLGNLVNPLTSLNFIFKIPALVIVTHRGEPGLQDEPQHELMGRAMYDLLSLLQVEHTMFPESSDAIDRAVATADERMSATSLPYAFVLRKGVLDEYTPRTPPARPFRPTGIHHPGGLSGSMPSRSAAIAVASDATRGSLVVATTGKTGRELFEYRDGPEHFYVVGSMGCASSLALGIAHTTREPVVVLDGDGAALMRLEAFAGIGHLGPRRFVHVLLDNRSYESTGGQATIAASVRFPEIALACGYASACSATGADALRDALIRALSEPGPHLIHTRVGIDTNAALGRPAVSPHEVAARFRGELARRSAVAAPDADGLNGSGPEAGG